MLPKICRCQKAVSCDLVQLPWNFEAFWSIIRWKQLIWKKNTVSENLREFPTLKKRWIFSPLWHDTVVISDPHKYWLGCLLFYWWTISVLERPPSNLNFTIFLVQSKALQSFHRATNGSTGWDFRGPICLFDGIKCNTGGDITRMYVTIDQYSQPVLYQYPTHPS